MTTPKIVSLDSAQLGNWARDREAANLDIRGAALDFENAFLDKGHVLVITLHHIIELVRHTPEIALSRMELLASLPHVAWPRTHSADWTIGNIIDLWAEEIKAAIDCKTAFEVRETVRPILFEFGSGRDAMGDHLDIWLGMRDGAFDLADSDRRNVAITRSNAAKAPDITVAELKAHKFRSPAALASLSPVLQDSLANEVKMRGDKRILNTDTVAANFYKKVMAHAGTLTGDVESAIRADLAANDVDLDELGPKAKLADLLELQGYRKRLKLVSRLLPTLSWKEIKEHASFEKLPTAMIERGLRLYGQDQHERKGSEITDRDLAAIATYADLTYVDKRTLNDLREVKRHFPAVKSLIQRTEKTSNWKTTIGQFS